MSEAKGEDRSRRFSWGDDDVGSLKIIQSKNIATPPADPVEKDDDADPDDEDEDTDDEE